ncbi:hypothetical protein L9F63_013300 [Diploptera punctata]|uniref:DUF4773 domain-containing protein n=1 Tax=Diploptera punctata TaxID=6984 RepID=A0AAD8AAJ0_DIPPU|nr:hypothetical protein L9F63_013300 [Diploptera punctata]
MRLSVVFELLLIFILLAFAASRVIEPQRQVERKNQKQGPPNRYCACTNLMCNCCREFSLPVVPVKGPGCATLTYVQGDNMMITMSFGNRVLHNTTITGKKPKPVCMPLPGGISKFCGRVYGISREGEKFKACLGLELRALDDLEAALRVSCFKFGPQGVNLEPAPPVPSDVQDDEKDEDDDDDDDDYGIGDDDDDDEDDDDDDDFGLDDDDDDDDDGDASGNVVSPDYGGFSVFGDDFLGGLFGDTNKKKKTPSKTKPKPALKPLRATTEKPVSTTIQPTKEQVKPSTKPATSTRPIRTTVRPIRRPSTTSTTRRPLPSRFTRPTKTTTTTSTTTTTTTTTTTPAPEIKLPETFVTVINDEEPITSTSITFTVMDENETVPPDTLYEDNMVSDGDEKLGQTDEQMEETTENVEETVDEASTEVNSEEDIKNDNVQGSNEKNDEDDEDDDEDDDDDDDNDEDDDDEDEDDEDSTNVNATATPNENEEPSANKSEKKKDDDDDDDDDILNLELDDDDDDEEEEEDDEDDNKTRSIHNTVVPLRSGRTHRRMRI